MRRQIDWWELGGFLFTVTAGTALHFLYAWSGQRSWAAVFAAVNESGAALLPGANLLQLSVGAGGLRAFRHGADPGFVLYLYRRSGEGLPGGGYRRIPPGGGADLFAGPGAPAEGGFRRRLAADPGAAAPLGGDVPFSLPHLPALPYPPLPGPGHWGIRHPRVTCFPPNAPVPARDGSVFRAAIGNICDKTVKIFPGRVRNASLFLDRFSKERYNETRYTKRPGPPGREGGNG